MLQEALVTHLVTSLVWPSARTDLSHSWHLPLSLPCLPELAVAMTACLSPAGCVGVGLQCLYVPCSAWLYVLHAGNRVHCLSCIMAKCRRAWQFLPVQLHSVHDQRQLLASVPTSEPTTSLPSLRSLPVLWSCRWPCLSVRTQVSTGSKPRRRGSQQSCWSDTNSVV